MAAGWTILARNVRVGRQEVDLVAVDPGSAGDARAGRGPLARGAWLRPAGGDLRRPQAGASAGRPRTPPRGRRATRRPAAALRGDPGGLRGRGATGSDPPPPSRDLRPSQRRRPSGAPPTAAPPRAGRIRPPSADPPSADAGPVLHSARPAHVGRCPCPPSWRSSHARPSRPGRCRTNRSGSRRPRSAEEQTEQEATRAHRLHAPAARGRHPFRPPDAALEPEDEAVHLRGTQRHPHHRPCPDGEGPRRRPDGRHRDGRPRRADPLRRARRSRPRSRSPRRRPAPASRTSTSAGSAACSPTS